VREAYEVRAELEGLAAFLAATCIRDDELRRLRAAQAHFRRSVDSLLAWRRRRGAEQPLVAAADAHAEWLEGNDVFHSVIQEASGNGRLQATIAIFTAASRAT
jgi:DNA-binding GntR family transcriptional regulator